LDVRRWMLPTVGAVAGESDIEELTGGYRPTVDVAESKFKRRKRPLTSGPGVATGRRCGGAQEPVGLYSNSSCCGRSSVIVYHGAFEPTKMWALGRIEGESTNVPSVTCTNSASRTRE
jgi:hypothetical protein